MASGTGKDPLNILSSPKQSDPLGLLVQKKNDTHDFTHGYKPTPEDLKTKESYGALETSFGNTPGFRLPDTNYKPAKKEKPTIKDAYVPKKQQEAIDKSALEDMHNQAVMQKYLNTLTPQEQYHIQNISNISNMLHKNEGLRASTPEEVEQQKAMDTTLGKVKKSLSYLGSEALTGGVDILKGGAWVLNHLNTGLTDTQVIPDKAWEGVDKFSQLGVTPTQRDEIENSRKMGWGAVNTLGMLARIAPAAVGGEAAELPKTAFAIQGFGQGVNTMNQVDPEHKLNPAVRDLFIAGSGAVNGLIMGDFKENVLSKPVQDKIVSGIVSHSLAEAAENGLTETSFKKAFKSTEEKMYDAFNSYAEKTGRASIDLSALQAANHVLKKGVDVMSDHPVFNANLGDLMGSISDIVTKQAPIFGGIGTMLSGGKKAETEKQKYELGQQIANKDSEIAKLSEKSDNPVTQAENEINLEQAKKDREDLNNQLKSIILKQKDNGKEITQSEVDQKEDGRPGQQMAERPEQQKESNAGEEGRKQEEHVLNESGEVKTEPGLKEQDNATKIESTGTLDVGEQAGNGETVGKGNTEPKEIAKKGEEEEVKQLKNQSNEIKNDNGVSDEEIRGQQSGQENGQGGSEKNDGEGKQVKKKILTQRAYEGEIQPEVKKHLEEKGLTRGSFSPDERSNQATEFIDKFGDDAAYKTVKNGDIDGALASSTMIQLQLKNSEAMQGLDPKSPEYKELAKKQADYIETLENKGYLAGEFVGQLAHEYEKAGLNYANVKRQLEKQTGKSVSPEQEKKIKDLTDRNETLKKELDNARSKLIEETDKAFNEGKEAGKSETKSQKAKRIADKIRAAKIHKPDVFSSATPASLVWDTAVETVAKTVEAGGKLADAIQAGVDHIKSSDWYKKLSDEKKQQATQEFIRYHHDNSGSNTLEDLQARFVDKKGNKFTPQEAKSIWGYIKERYLEKGDSFPDAISKTARDLGLSFRQVNEAITTPKTKRVSDEMWKKNSDYSRQRTVIKDWINEQNQSKVAKALRNFTGFFRGTAVFGHGAIFVGTHAGTTLFTPATFSKTVKAFINGYRFAYGNEAEYARRMEELKRSPNYLIAQRAGLKNDPDNINAEEYQKSQKYLDKIGLGKLAHMGERGFNAIKVLRQDLFDYSYNRLSAAEKEDPEVAKSIAKLMNLATNATNLKIPKEINEITFAGGMEASRWQKLLQSPAKSASVLGKVLNGTATPSEKVFARIWAQRVGQQVATYYAALLANAALQNQISPNNAVNYTDPNKPDFLKFKIGDISIDPTSGMRSTAMFLKTIGQIPFQKETGDRKIKVLGKDLASYGRGKLSPFYGIAADFFESKDFSGNPMPYSDEIPKGNAHHLSWGEYGSSKLPLPVAEALGVFFKSAEEHGASKAAAKGIVSGLISGSTGFRVSEDADYQTPIDRKLSKSKDDEGDAIKLSKQETEYRKSIYDKLIAGDKSFDENKDDWTSDFNDDWEDSKKSGELKKQAAYWKQIGRSDKYIKDKLADIKQDALNAYIEKKALELSDQYIKDNPMPKKNKFSIK